MSITGVGFRPFSVYGAPGPKFGWTRKNPPENCRLALSHRDFADVGTLMPAPDLVRRIADNLTGEVDSTPRFTLVTNTLPLLGSEARVRAFEAKLFRAVVEDLEKRYPGAITPNEVSQAEWERIQPYFPEADFSGDTVRLIPDESGRKPMEGYGSVKKVVDEETGETKQVSSYKALHSDGQGARIFSLCYGPCQNVRGGRPRVADVRQYRVSTKTK